MKTVEYWKWRYRDPLSGRMCQTTFPLSAREAAKRHPDAERIEETLTLREVYDEQRDTVPGIFRNLHR